MNITVLCGGVSSEREISLRSSVKVSQALKSRGHNVIMIDVFFGEEVLPQFGDEQDYAAKADELRSKTPLITRELIASVGLTGKNVLKACQNADIVFLGLHGENGEDGKIQAFLDANHIKYTGTGSEASALAMSKTKTKHIIAPHIRMPKGTVIRKDSIPQEHYPVPCVFKPDNGGSSLGVMIVKDDAQYEDLLDQCFSFCDTVVAETYVDGRELTQGVLNGRPLPPVEICPDGQEWYDYTNKYNGLTKEVCPAQIDEDVLKQMSEASVKFGELLGLQVYYRVDYLLGKDGVLYALEANTLPGMTDTSLIPQEARAVGIDFPELCEKICLFSLKKYEA